MRQWTIDAFASQPFRGNPACVVEPLDAWPADTWMQALAAENNQAETAFLLKTGAADRFGLRWFTPALEVPLCGHATLAAAHALFAELGLASDRVEFETLSGVLTVTRRDDGYAMDFPSCAPEAIESPPGLVEALGMAPAEVWASQFLACVMDGEDAVRTVAPDLARLKDISSAATQGRGNVGVCAEAGAGQPYDVVSRFFAPGSGIPEDPTTGSWHCILAPLFSEKLGRDRLVFHQAYPGRGGDLVCTVRGDRVQIEGQATTVTESRLRVTPA